jgi:hypothetical protein
MISKCKITLLFLLFVSCSSPIQDTFNSKELQSSKGEKIYINSLNWGITDDYQITAITSNKSKLKTRNDTTDIVKGLDPFIYSFKNDTLNLFFRNNISYELKEAFRTISIKYIVLSNEDFYKARLKAINQSVPENHEINYPSDFPKAPKD